MFLFESRRLLETGPLHNPATLYKSAMLGRVVRSGTSKTSNSYQPDFPLCRKSRCVTYVSPWLILQLVIVSSKGPIPSRREDYAAFCKDVTLRVVFFQTGGTHLVITETACLHHRTTANVFKIPHQQSGQ